MNTVDILRLHAAGNISEKQALDMLDAISEEARHGGVRVVLGFFAISAIIVVIIAAIRVTLALT